MWSQIIRNPERNPRIERLKIPVLREGLHSHCRGTAYTNDSRQLPSEISECVCEQVMLRFRRQVTLRW